MLIQIASWQLPLISKCLTGFFFSCYSTILGKISPVVFISSIKRWKSQYALLNYISVIDLFKSVKSSKVDTSYICWRFCNLIRFKNISVPSKWFYSGSFKMVPSKSTVSLTVKKHSALMQNFNNHTNQIFLVKTWELSKGNRKCLTENFLRLNSLVRSVLLLAPA